ncbi:hypothetical protein [Nigerium massiliense]|uniref:hypothetical protein n=1 Tax=Nigerium massiliense TaxID=1522317 RepID=UPI001C461651|nr:hypothetical protein [Nigerium massiliense]
MTEGVAGIDANILGRVTYQEWSHHWPKVTQGEDAGLRRLHQQHAETRRQLDAEAR